MKDNLNVTHEDKSRQVTKTYTKAFEAKDYICYLSPKYKIIGKNSTPNLIISIVEQLKTNKHLDHTYIYNTIDQIREYPRYKRTVIQVIKSDRHIELFCRKDGVFPTVFFELIKQEIEDGK